MDSLYRIPETLVDVVACKGPGSPADVKIGPPTVTVKIGSCQVSFVYVGVHVGIAGAVATRRWTE